MKRDEEEWQAQWRALWGAWCASWRRSPDEVIDVDAAYRQFSRRHGGAGVYAARERRTRRDLKRLERRCKRRMRRLHERRARRGEAIVVQIVAAPAMHDAEVRRAQEVHGAGVFVVNLWGVLYGRCVV